jgi:hypothetical protein
VAIETISTKDAAGVQRDVLADQIGAAFAQVVKVGWGADGTLNLAEAAAPLPVTDAALASALASILAAVDGLEGFTDGIEALLGRLPSGGTASEATLASLLTELGQKLEPGDLASLATAAKQDLAKTVLDNLLTQLTAVNANTDGLEGFTDGLESLLGGATPTASAAATASVQLVAGAGRLLSFSARETTGSASAVFRLRDGSGGTIMATVALVAGESVRDGYPNGIAYSTSLYLERVSGTTEVTVATR